MYNSRFIRSFVWSLVIVEYKVVFGVYFDEQSESEVRCQARFWRL
jgi:hypothetical protein